MKAVCKIREYIVQPARGSSARAETIFLIK